jgi:hypothetical protein
MSHIDLMSRRVVTGESARSAGHPAGGPKGAWDRSSGLVIRLRVVDCAARVNVAWLPRKAVQARKQ